MATATRQRGNGEGSVYPITVRRRNGATTRWVAQVVVNGRKRRLTATTEAAAKRKLRELVRAIDSGLPITPGDLTVCDLLDQWDRKALPNRHLEPSTVARHRESIKSLNAELGGRKIRTLTPEIVEAAFERRAAAGAARATLAKLRTTLGMALAWAERRGLVARNVAAVVELPASARPAAAGRAMTVEQARTFLGAAEGTPLSAMWVTMLYLGLRPGEAAGLSWDDVDLTYSVVHVRRGRKLGAGGRAVIGSPKTPQSVRSLEAPEPVIASLRQHRQSQNRQRLAAGDVWRNDEDLVFTSATGAPSDPARVRREFDAVITVADLGDGWSPNMLRHTAASLLSDAGAPLEQIADLLGHRDTRMASLHYRHRVRPTVAGAEVLASVLSG